MRFYNRESELDLLDKVNKRTEKCGQMIYCNY